MQQRRLTASLFFATLMALTLLGCNGEERQKREQAAVAERQLSALVSRCRGQQPTVQRHLQELQRSSSELANLKQQAYSPLRRPAGPDPELLARFTREDQELEQERYEQAMATWRSSDRPSAATGRVSRRPSGNAARPASSSRKKPCWP